MISKEIEQAIDKTLRPVLQRMGMSAIRVEEGENHAGDPVIWVHVDYGPGGDPIDTKATASLVSKLRRRLYEMGEERFPHIRHHFREDQKVRELS